MRPLFQFVAAIFSMTSLMAHAASDCSTSQTRLVCAFCAQGIEKKLHAFPATADVVVSLEKKLVAVSMKDGQDIPDDKLKDALTNAGYTVKAIRRENETLDDVRQRLKAGTK